MGSSLRLTGSPQGDHSPLRSRLRRRLLPCLGLSTLVACGEGGTAPSAVRVSLTPVEALLIGAGDTRTFVASAIDKAGARVQGTPTWTIGNSEVATVSQSGVVSAVSAGVTSVTASMDGVTGSARVEVFVPERIEHYEPGTSYWGRAGYVEYIPGRLPVVLSAGHGGSMRPGEIPTRTYGTTGADLNTRELTLDVRDALLEITGFAPHTIISHLHRSRLDPNREVVEAAQDNVYAEHAYEEYHELIRIARRQVELDFGEGFYVDMHGHSHAVQRLELGYLLTSDELNGADATLDQLAVVARSSLRDLGRDSPIPFSALLRGPTSLGGYLAAEGVPVVPSPSDPSPGTDPYWRGGYSTRIHGSVIDGEVVSGVQIEHHWDQLRDTAASREAYARRLAQALGNFMLAHYGFFEPN